MLNAFQSKNSFKLTRFTSASTMGRSRTSSEGTEYVDDKEFNVFGKAYWIDLSPKDPSLRSKYHAYIHRSQSALSQLVLNLLCIYFTIEICIYFLANYYRSSSALFLSILVVILSIIVDGSGWAIFLYLARKRSCSSDTLDCLKSNWLLAFEFSFTSILTLNHVVRSVSPCGNDNMLVYHNCNSINKPDYSMDSAMILMLCPFIFVTVLQEIRPSVVILTWAIVVASLFFTTVWFRSNSSMVLVVYYSAVSFLILCENLRQKYNKFLHAQTLEEAVDESKKAAEEEMTAEMKHMIANIAHDLKTVGPQSLKNIF